MLEIFRLTWLGDSRILRQEFQNSYFIILIAKWGCIGFDGRCSVVVVRAEWGHKRSWIGMSNHFYPDSNLWQNLIANSYSYAMAA